MGIAEAPEPSKINILLVDDRPDGVFAMEAVLKSPEYNLITANSGEEALRHFLREDFAVVLLDVQMPGMDGFETARLMRRSEGAHKTPIIFVTAISIEDKYVYTGYETGAVDYVFKPFDPTILRSKVAVFADLYRMAQELQRQSELVRDMERRDREQMIAALELESLRRYRGLADAIPHIVWKAKPDATLDYFNKIWVDYTGLALEQSEGNGWKKALPREDVANLFRAWEASAKNGSGFDAECRIRRAKDGALRWHLLRGVPEVNADGRVTSWIVTCTEIHERKMAEEARSSLLSLEKSARREIERAKLAAEEANRAKSQLLANMSHEIRTPLGIVLGLSELMLESTPSEEERTESLQTILRNGRQLSKLVDDILDISKIEAGRLELESVSFLLRDLVEDMNATAGFHARQKGLELHFEIADNVPVAVKSDPTRLRQILTNVLGNAVKFTERGSVVARIKVDGDPAQRQRLVFTITDTGIGIPAPAQERLFQDFMQADTTTTRRFGGTGLGLALSRRLSRLLGGDLVLASSHEGQGSCFKFWIEIEAVVIPLASSSADQADRRLDGLKVLLVEDAPDNQLLVRRMLQRVGARVDLANDGAEGIEQAIANDYDIVLMDIQMPNVDGYEAVRTLREKRYSRPIIALTAHAMKEERERCLERGFDDHLTKPIKHKELLDQIRRHVQPCRPHDKIGKARGKGGAKSFAVP